MDRFLVTGGARLDGTVHVSGAKNSALKLMAASILAPGCSVVRFTPKFLRPNTSPSGRFSRLDIRLKNGSG